ncbi:MAG: membrane protease YdiL (CAAX protease family) [Planctomycetaceae bacterium]|jgi:membrane protease YdiL (CAAX protease family)
MPDPTTPDDRLDPQPAETPDDSPWIEDSSAEPALDEAPLDAAALDVEARAEVAAFRENLESGSVAGSASSDADDREEVSRQLRSLRRLMTLRPPGPGIPEAVAWMVAVVLVHILGGIVGGVVIIVGQVMRSVTPGTPPTTEIVLNVVKSFPQLVDTYLFELMMVETIVFFVAAVVATRLRLGARMPRLLGVHALTTKHLLLILAVWIPLAQSCGGLQLLTSAAWEQWFAHLPGMSFFDNTNVNETIKPLGERVPIGLLFLVIAVAPAITEEIIFRGVIGRGLVARHGILAGVIMTSVLFAAVHIHPAHVVALLPLAFFIHLIYLVTRSILAPMLLHLLNNSLAVVLLKITATTPALADASEPNMPWYVMVISAGIVGLVGWTLWQSRVEYRTDDDELWSPGYPSVEIPPASAGASLTMTDCPVGLHRGAIGLAGAYSLMFVVLLVLTLTGHISA